MRCSGWHSKSALAPAVNRIQDKASCLMKLKRWLNKPFGTMKKKLKCPPARSQSAKRYLPIFLVSAWCTILRMKISSVIAANMPCIRLAKTLTKSPSLFLPSESHRECASQVCLSGLREKRYIKQNQTSPRASESYPQRLCNAEFT